MALNYGFKPVFFADNISWEQYLRNEKAPLETPLDAISSASDERLINVWRDLRKFTQAVNLAFQVGGRVKIQTFQEIIISAQYRLLHLSYDQQDTHEVIRLGMLAIASTLFLGIHGAPAKYGYLTSQFRRSLQSSEQLGTEEWSKLTLWLLFAASSSVFGTSEDEGWLQERLVQVKTALGLSTWPAVREVLKSHLWVDAINDEAGRRFFETGVRNSHSELELPDK